MILAIDECSRSVALCVWVCVVIICMHMYLFHKNCWLPEEYIASTLILVCPTIPNAYTWLLRE